MPEEGVSLNHGGYQTSPGVNFFWSWKVENAQERLADALHNAAEDEGVHCDDELDEESFTGQDAVITELERSSFMEPL